IVLPSENARRFAVALELLLVVSSTPLLLPLSCVSRTVPNVPRWIVTDWQFNTVTVGWLDSVNVEQPVASTLNCVVVVRFPVGRLIVPPAPATAPPTGAPASVFNW